MDKQTNQCTSLMADWKADTLFYLLQDANADARFPKNAKDLPLLMENGKRGIILALFTTPQYARQMALHLPLQISSAVFSDLQGLLASYPGEIDGVVLNLRQDPQFISAADFLACKPERSISSFKAEESGITEKSNLESEPGSPVKSNASVLRAFEKIQALPQPEKQMALETRPKNPNLLPALNDGKELTPQKEAKDLSKETEKKSQPNGQPAVSKKEAAPAKESGSQTKIRPEEPAVQKADAKPVRKSGPCLTSAKPEKTAGPAKAASLLDGVSQEHLPAIVPVYEMAPGKKSLREKNEENSQKAGLSSAAALPKPEEAQAFVSEEEQAAMSFKTNVQREPAPKNPNENTPAQPAPKGPAGGLPLHLPGGNLRPQAVSALKRAARQIASVQKIWVGALNLEKKPTWVLIAQSDEPIEKTASDSLMQAFIKKQMPGQSVMIFPSNHAYVQQYISKTKPVYTRRLPR